MVGNWFEAYIVIVGEKRHYEQEKQVHDKPEDAPNDHQIVLTDQLFSFDLGSQMDIIESFLESSNRIDQN